MKYYLIIDVATQWFTRVIQMDDKEMVVEKTDIHTGITGEFIRSIVSRDMAFTHKVIEEQSYCGYSISQWEYNKLKRLAELFPLQSEYNNILKLV